MTHELKIEKAFLEAKKEGDKLFEIRFNGDRGFQKGDLVKYFDHESNDFIHFLITYVSNYEQRANWVVFGEKPLED